MLMECLPVFGGRKGFPPVGWVELAGTVFLGLPSALLGHGATSDQVGCSGEKEDVHEVGAWDTP